jgi:8-oxo-dGTP diphosphatase
MAWSRLVAPADSTIDTIAAGPGIEVIQVAVGVILNPAGEVLVSLRPRHVDQGNLWEFPGGKVEPGEDVQQALAREIEEEVGLRIERARPLIRLRHDYPAKSVLLDVWRVTAYSGQVYGREGQRLAWLAPQALNPADFPAANSPIITAVRLPPLYLITPEPEPPHAVFLSRLERLLDAGVRLVQLRAKSLEGADFHRLAADVIALCRARGAQVLLNGSPEQCLLLGADGVHLNSERLLHLSARPLPADRLVAASCHDRQQIDHAGRIGVDFIAVSPVRATYSHPAALPLGWGGLRSLVEPAVVPAYALGGLAPGDLMSAWGHGAQGVAAIRSLWEAPHAEDLIRAGTTG